jgi:hypothetical protein
MLNQGKRILNQKDKIFIDTLLKKRKKQWNNVYVKISKFGADVLNLRTFNESNIYCISYKVHKNYEYSICLFEHKIYTYDELPGASANSSYSWKKSLYSWGKKHKDFVGFITNPSYCEIIKALK